MAVAVLAASGVACSNSSSGPAQEPTNISSRQTRVAGEYLVTLAPRADPKVIDEQYGRFHIVRTQSMGNDIYLVTLTDDPGPNQMQELGARSAHIKLVQPNFTYRANDLGKAR